MLAIQGITFAAEPASSKCEFCSSCGAGEHQLHDCSPNADRICTPTPPGYYSANGSPDKTPCGGPSLYCPGGEGGPRTVSEGYETYTDAARPDAPFDLNSSLTRTSERPCADGDYCQAGLANPCPLGSFCGGGVQHTCPAWQ